MDKSQSSQREGNIRAILALTSLRRVQAKLFLQMALEEMTDEQVCILIQRIGEWMHENPPKKEGAEDT